MRTELEERFLVCLFFLAEKSERRNESRRKKLIFDFRERTAEEEESFCDAFPLSSNTFFIT